jgi:sigma-E processing peptidase SpoIIGA
MVVYIEYVILDNLVITSIIALLSQRIMKVRPSKLRTTAAAVLGTTAAVFYPFMSIHIVFLFLIKVGLFFALSFVLFFKKPKFFHSSAVFLFVTAALGGVMFLISFMLVGDVVSALTLGEYDFPLGLLLLIPIIFYLLLKKLAASVACLRAKKDFSYDIEIIAQEKTIKAKGYFDSGNMLFDQKSGLPIVVAGCGLTLQILTDKQLEMILKNKGQEIDKQARYIDYATIKGQEKLLILPIKNLRIYFENGRNILKEVMLGLSLVPLKNGADALLPLMLSDIVF